MLPSLSYLISQSVPLSFVSVAILPVDITILPASYGEIPTNGLVAYYTFNGNANDTSGNKSNGSVTGAVLTTDRFGIKNSAYYFDGIYSHIEVEMQNSSLQLNNKALNDVIISKLIFFIS
mgnify:CR=1 FL=1